MELKIPRPILVAITGIAIAFVLSATTSTPVNNCSPTSDCPAVAPDLIVNIYLGTSNAIGVTSKAEDLVCPDATAPPPTTVRIDFSIPAADTLTIMPEGEHSVSASISDLRTQQGTNTWTFLAQHEWIVRPSTPGDFLFISRAKKYIDDCLVSIKDTLIQVRALNAYSMDLVTEERIKMTIAIISGALGIVKTFHELLKILAGLAHRLKNGITKTTTDEPSAPPTTPDTKKQGRKRTRDKSRNKNWKQA